MKPDITPTTTEVNWRALKQVATLYLLELRELHPAWTLEDLFEKGELPCTALFLALGEQAGFRMRDDPTPAEMTAVAGLCIRGVSADEVIARETGLTLERVRQILMRFTKGYGDAPYGIVPYGGNRQVSDGRSAVPRRVTKAGQMSYRGHIYTLGAAYRGRTAMLVERGSRLMATFPDRRTLDLACRHYTPT